MERWFVQRHKMIRTRAFRFALAATALVGACEGPDGPLDGEEAAQVQSSIMGGTTITNHQEIGVFWNGFGRGCTATLIHPRYVLAAAHCAEPAYTGTAVNSGSVFVVTSPDGTQTNYNVERLHPFAAWQFEQTPSGLTTDVLLVRLASEVPTNFVFPRRISSVPPVSGGRATIHGFGCTDLNSQMGGGPRRFFSFNYPGPTLAVCWGDSGGPVTLGNVDDYGGIWGVNSDWKNRGTTLPLEDWFGDAAEYKSQIVSLINRWDSPVGLEASIDRPGMDYQNLVGTSSASVCRQQCLGDPKCRAFTFVQGSPNSCYLKSAIPEWYGSTSAITSSADFTAEENIERVGSTYRNFDPPSGRAEVCLATCGAEERCQAYSFRPASSGVTARCYLKDFVPGATTKNGWTSGMKRGLEANVDRPGYDYRNFITTATNGEKECRITCAQEDQCRAFSYDTVAKRCWLKNRAALPTPRSNITSGVKRGLQVGIDRGGSDYRDFFTSVPLPQVCQAACARESQCIAWTYVKPNIQGNQARCWLKSDVPAAGVNGNTVSGFKGADFF